ncbi:MAG: hypothetical protein HY801_10335 [Candidatus Lindowbacteria bacterium]|nr:hypothetical protein [Candidatus Lindowbacteria bacterium]
MITFIARVLLVVFSASIGYVIGGTFEPVRTAYEITGLLIGAGIAFVIIGFEYLIKKFSFEGLVAPTVGLILGMVTASFVISWLDLVLPESFTLFNQVKTFLTISLMLFRRRQAQGRPENAAGADIWPQRTQRAKGTRHKRHH